MKKVHNEMPDTASPVSTEQYKKMLVLSLIKMSIPVVLCTVVFCLASIAWFAKNSDVRAKGAGISAAGPTFEVSMLQDSKDNIFKDPYHIRVHEEDALYWKMTATNNLINYNQPVDQEGSEADDNGDQGIHPGTEGVISFYVIPKVESVDLDFDFEIIGYQASTDDKGTEGIEDDDIIMTKLTDLSNNEGATAQNLLNGHILLFEHRDETTINGVTTVTYSMPIVSNQDMHRIMNRTICDKDKETLINIYWVWPNTLSTLVDARSFSGITTVPFCKDDDAYDYDSYSAITANVTTYPHYFLKGADANDTITTGDIADHYDYYGDMYDQGDNEIGMRVHYLLIKLSVRDRNVGIEGTTGNNKTEELNELGGGE